MREVPRLDTMTLRCVPTEAGSVFVTWTNFGRVDFAITWARNLQRMGIHNIFVGALDAESLQVRDLVMHDEPGLQCWECCGIYCCRCLSVAVQCMEPETQQTRTHFAIFSLLHLQTQVGIGRSRHSHICHVPGGGQRDGWRQR